MMQPPPGIGCQDGAACPETGDASAPTPRDNAAPNATQSHTRRMNNRDLFTVFRTTMIDRLRHCVEFWTVPTRPRHAWSDLTHGGEYRRTAPRHPMHELAAG